MIDSEFTEKPSASLFGKEFIIVLVIIFSGLSFTLGYFVGKNGAPKPEPALQAVESSAQVQKQELPTVSPLPAVPPASEQPKPALPPVKEPLTPIAPVTEKPAQQLTTNVTKTTPAEVKEKGQQKSPVALPQKSAEAQSTKPAPEKSVQKVEPSATSESKSSIYTVQIGAFKNIAEAKQLKAKFDKKGHKSFISTVKNKKAQKIFKVKTGEFREKKEAEVLALKLKKTEGLQTYVTLKSE